MAYGFTLPPAEFLLVIVLRESRFPVGADGWRDSTGLSRDKRAEKLEAGYIRYTPASWLHDPITDKTRRSFSKHLKAHEAAGAMEAERDGSGRVVWIRLLPEGERRALEIAERDGIELPPEPIKRAPPPTRLERIQRELVSGRKCAERCRERIARYDEEIARLNASPDYFSRYLDSGLDHLSPEIKASLLTREKAVAFRESDRKRLADITADIRYREQALTAELEATEKSRKESKNA